MDQKRELAKPGVIDEYKAADPPLAKAIDWYTEESLREIGRALGARSRMPSSAVPSI